jgi:2-polyprenyl-6-methoxyphenol hydroxylase-like FAD-dependent oxidoreductase
VVALLQASVVIIGAGPTGLSLAAQLKRYGIDFIIIEQNEKPTHLSKAIAVQARTLEIFRELGIADKAIAAGRMTTAMNLFFKGNQKASVDLSGLGEGLSPFPFALSLEQSKTEKVLSEYLSDDALKIYWGAVYSHFEQDEKKVTVHFRDHSGQEFTVESIFLVGCDGAGSIVRHQIGATFKGDTVPKIFYVADVLLKSGVITRNQLYMFMISKGFILFFPMEGEGHYRVIGILPEARNDHGNFTFPEIKEEIIKQVEVPLEFQKEIWFSSYKVHSRKANTFRNKRCFIAGDAGHIHTPAGGQGMNTGIQDAYNLAWKLAFVIKGNGGDALLETYNTERMQNAKNLLRTTDRMFDILSGVNRFWNFIRLTFLPSFFKLISKRNLIQKRLFPLISQTGITYHDSFLTIPSKKGKVKAGVRMPYFKLSNGKDILGYLTDPDFKLLYFGAKNKEQFSLKTHSFNEIPSALFGNEKDFYVLLRPDNHISYIGNDPKPIRLLLEKITPNSKL